MSQSGRKGDERVECPHLTYARKVLIAVAITLATVILICLLWFARNIALLVFAGILIGIFLQWGKRGIMRFTNLPALVSLGILLIIIVLPLALFIGFLVPVVIDQSAQLAQQIPESIASFKAFLFRFGLEDDFERQTDKAEDILLGYDREQLLGIIKNIVGIFSTTFGALFGILVIFIIGIYIAADRGLYVEGILRLFPRTNRRC